jgi:hypothetical protein
LKRTKSQDVGRFLDYLASEPVYAEYMARTENPRTRASRKRASTQDLPQAKAAMNVRRQVRSSRRRHPDPGLQAQSRDLQSDGRDLGQRSPVKCRSMTR